MPQSKPKILFFILFALLLAGISFWLFKSTPLQSTTESLSPKITHEKPEVKPNPVYDNESGSFEKAVLDTGVKTDWATISSEDSKAIFSIVEGGVDGDGHALQVEIEKVSGQNKWDIQAVREQIFIRPESLQRLSAWVKGPLGAEMVFSVEAPEDYRLIKNQNVILVGEWQQVYFEFDTQDEELRTAMHFSFPGNEGAKILVDNVKVESTK